MRLPPAFTDLAAAYHVPDGSLVSIIGVITDLMPATQIFKTGQHMVTFSLLDESFQNSIPGLQGLAVRFFKEDATKLPKLGGLGDVVLLRSVRMVTVGGRKMAVSSHATATLVFRSASIPTPGFRIVANDQNKINCHGTPADIARLSQVEQSYVIDVKHAMGDTIAPLLQRHTLPKRVDVHHSIVPAPKRAKLSAASSSAATAYGPKFRLISDLTNKLFADIVGQVVKRFATLDGKCDLYITDYTENQLMFHYPAPEEEAETVRDGDAFGYSDPQKRTWPGPYGFLVLKVNVMPPQSNHVNATVEVGDFVLLRNVKCKIQNVGLRLEGDIWPDTVYPDKVQVQKLRKEEQFAIPDIQRRKDQYWSARMRLNARNVQGKDEPRPPDAGNTSKSNTSKARTKKRRNRASEAAIAAHTAEIPAHESDTTNTGRSDVNRHVRCSHDDIRVASVKDILDPDNARHSGVSPTGQTFIAPFVNAKYRAKVRVVDYEPKDLEDFSVPSTYIDDDDASDSMAWVAEDSQRHEWYFRLLLEGANSVKMHASAEYNRLWVDVGHEQAQFLFGNDMEDPKDLRLDTQQLAKLKEKLFVLWGNLEESGGQGLSNLPFECCIMEYGMKLGDSDSSKQKMPKGWSRAYSMFGTTIM